MPENNDFLIMNILTKAKETVNNIGRMLVKMTDQSGMLIPSYMSNGDKPILFSTEAVLYYQMCAPIFTAVDKLCMEASSINPVIFSKKDDKFIYEHPILDLLQYPYSNITWSEMMYAIVAWFLITGNVYITADGFVEKIPRNLRIYPSQTTTIIPNVDGIPDVYQARFYTITDTYNRREVINYNRKRDRYYLSVAPDFKEIYHIRTFNPMQSSMMVYGLSPFNALYYEIQQYIHGAKHNLSVLQRGSRLTGVWKTDKMLSDEQRTRLQQQIDTIMSGSINAGRNLLIDGDSPQYEDLIKNNRDMDYVEMHKRVNECIYNALDIPLPLVSEQHMTLANLEGSKAIFYESAVLQLVKRIFEELTSFLMPRFDNENDDLIITFNENDISALEPKRNEQAKIKKEIGIFTINEIRKLYGLEPLINGNVIYGTISDTPIATDINDPYYTEEPKKPIEEKPDEQQEQIEETEEEKKASKDKFISTLRRQVNKDGSLRFSEDEILELAKRHYG